LRLLIVDDHPVVVSGAAQSSPPEDNVEILAAASGERAIEAFFETGADIALVDINLPGLSGFEAIRRILARNSAARLIAFSMNDDPAVVTHAIEIGALGYLTKTDKPKHFLEALDAVAAGENYLTPDMARQMAFFRARSGEKDRRLSKREEREEEILRLLAAGKSVADIADRLDHSYKTVANNCTAMKEKLGARTMQDLVRIALESRKPQRRGRDFLPAGPGKSRTAEKD
jgi:two-component system invasion response regulator UvrY